MKYMGILREVSSFVGDIGNVHSPSLTTPLELSKTNGNLSIKYYPNLMGVFGHD